MIPDPLRRRYGRGVARLRLGADASSVSLSEVARTPIGLERLFSSAPEAACLLLATALVLWSLSGSLARRERELQLTRDETPLRIRMAVEATAPDAPRPPPRAPRIHEIPPSVAPAANAAKPATTSKARVMAASEPNVRLLRPHPRRGLEALQLARALRAPHVPAPALGATTLATAGPGDASRPRPFDREESDLPLAAVSTSDAPVVPSDPLATSAPFGRNAQPPPDRARPAVSAGPTTGTLSAIRAHLTASREAVLGAGWSEVSLDTLPDCSPAGRQDALKRRILRIAAHTAECTLGGERFRFVETRELGSFLMGTRRVASATAPTRRRDRTACEVLERALRCLEEGLEGGASRR